MCLRLLILSICFACFFKGYSSIDSTAYYLIYFKSKSNTDFQIQKPEFYLSQKSIERRKKFNIKIDSSDLPVNEENIKFLRGISDISIIGKSKWLNAVEITIPNHSDNYGIAQTKIDSILKVILSNRSVSKIKYLGKIAQNLNSDEIETIDSRYFDDAKKLKSLKQDSTICLFESGDYNKSYAQNKFIGVPILNRLSQKMDNFHIAVFDAGFHNAYRIKGMEDLLDSNQIIRDYVDCDNSVWEDDQHGCNVLGFMKTYNPGFYIGSAPFAKYTLIRTENVAIESLTEEVNWLMAAEFVDSLGIDMISASVGYHTFDEKALSHSYKESNGKTALISQAANLAYRKGIMVVVSAGNEGDHSWHYISFPADAEGVITIGSCDEKGYHSKFSSCGPTVDGRVKPDFLAPGYKVNVASTNGSYAGNGTSYSTPIFAGAMANLMYLNPTIGLDSIKGILRYSSTHRNISDSFYGYGLPDFALANCLLKGFAQITDDIFWVNTEAVTFQELNLYFISSHNQNVNFSVYTQIKGKRKLIYKKVYVLKKGQVIDNDILLQYLTERKKLKRKKWVLNNIEMLFISDHGTFQKTFQFR